MQTTMHTFVLENIWDLVTMVVIHPGDRNTGSTVLPKCITLYGRSKYFKDKILLFLPPPNTAQSAKKSFPSKYLGYTVYAV